MTVPTSPLHSDDDSTTPVRRSLAAVGPALGTGIGGRIKAWLRSLFAQCSAPDALLCEVHGWCSCFDPEERWEPACTLHGDGAGHISGRGWG